MPSAEKSTLDERHRIRMMKKKAIIDQKVAKAVLDKGVILVNTGNGKGKSSAGFGVVARALGHHMRVGIIQFIKGGMPTGEAIFFRQQAQVEYHLMGEGFTWETQSRQQDIQAAQQAWQCAKALLENPAIDLVLLDELNIVLKYGYLSIQDVVQDITNKPEMQHVVITGRAAKPEILALADTVTEMQDVKHAFRAGIRAQKGMEL